MTVLALVLLVLFAALGVAFSSATNNTVLQSANQAHVQGALLLAESGLAFCQRLMSGVSLPARASGDAMMDALAASLSGQLNGTANLGGAVVSYDGGTTLTIPSVAVEGGKSFSASVTRVNDTTVRVRATGLDGTVSRTVSLDFNVEAGCSVVLDYGIASKSAIVLTGNDRILGANDASEACILSATYSQATAISMTGNARIQGDLFVSNPAGQVSLTGNVSVGGATGGGIADHVHIGVGDVEFPEVDGSVFEPFATNIVNASTPTSGNRTFTNIRIRAGTNPTFSGNITIKGVVYVEAPNRVQFTGNLNFTGVIVTQDAGEDAYDTNTIKFTGNTTSSGVENLPDTSEFHQLRQMPGAFLLAPGFGVSFTGNFGTVNGAMAADQFKFTGNAGGTVYGPIINYSDSEFRMTGNSSLTFNRSRYSNDIPGLAQPGKLAADASTYREN